MDDDNPLEALAESLETAFGLLSFSAIYYEGVLTVRIETTTAEFNDDGELLGVKNMPRDSDGGSGW